MIRARSIHGLINPLHLNQLIDGNIIQGIMLSPTKFSFDGDIYISHEPLDNPNDERVILLNDKGITAVEILSVWLQQKAEQQKVQEQARQLVLERQREVKRNSELRWEQFYKAYEFPFTYSVRSKHVMSGLSENSWGDGSKRNSVYHLYAEDAVNDRKLKREPGSFLCTPNDNGKLFYLNDDKEAKKPIVSCKKCLAIMNRWKTVSD